MAGTLSKYGARWMTFVPRAVVSILAGIASLTGAGAHAAPPPIEAFGSIPQVANVAMNPGGTLLAWSDSSTAATKIIIFDLAASKVKQTFDIGNMKLRDVAWADDETVLLEVSQTLTPPGGKRPLEWFRVLAASASGGTPRMLLMTGDRTYVTAASLLALRTPQPRTVIMSTLDFELTKDRGIKDTRFERSRKDTGWVLNLFEVDTVSGKGRRIEQGNQYTDEWIIGNDGQAVARSDWNPQQSSFRILRKDGMGWKEIYQANEGVSVYGVTSDGSSIVAVGAMGGAHAKAWAIPLDGSAPKVLLEDPQYDIDGILRDSFSNAPIGAVVGGPQPDAHWFDEGARARHKAMDKAFAGRNVTITGRSQDNSRAIAHVSSHSLPGIYYLVDFKKGTADVVGEDYPALAGVPLGTARSITYKARDGIEITGYVTMPPGTPTEKLPMVVLPHGGPEARDDTRFDWWAQFLASRGYVVFQPQFRGSTGFGEEFRKAGYHQWGGLMQDDVTDGVKALIEQRVADPHRIAIVGASYGGYAALAGAAFTPELYACAVSVSGVADLPAMLGYSEQKTGDESDTVAYWRVSIGGQYDANVIAKSPARAAENIRAPVLLLHGIDDTVVPLSQSEMMARALDKANKDYQFVKLPGEDHWLSRSTTRIRMLSEVEKFLATNMPAAQ